MPKIKSHCIRKPAVLSPRIPDNSEPIHVETGKRWENYAYMRGMDVWELIRFNYPTLPANNKDAALEVNWYLENYVGSTVLSTGDTNYGFSTADKPGLIFLPLPKRTWVPWWRKRGLLIVRPPGRILNFWRFERTLTYMHQEMITNAAGTDAADIAALNASGGSIDKMAAYANFAALVMTNGPWDHKPILRRMLSLTSGDMHFPFRGDGKHEFFYDIWSNIHYAYVGRAAGFREFELQGAHHLGGITGASDPFDTDTVQIGLDIWHKHGTSLTKTQLHEEIMAAIPRLLVTQGSRQYIAVNGSFKHIEPVTNGR